MASAGSDSFLSTPPGRELLLTEQADRGGSDRIFSLEDMGLLFSVLVFPLLFTGTKIAVNSTALPGG